MSKAHRILRTLASGRALTRFDAETLGDHTLPQTVHSLEHRHGLVIHRQRVRVQGPQGGWAYVSRYRISAKAQRDRAREVLRTTKPKGAA